MLKAEPSKLRPVPTLPLADFRRSMIDLQVDSSIGTDVFAASFTLGVKGAISELANPKLFSVGNGHPSEYFLVKSSWRLTYSRAFYVMEPR